jgi:hypothetical protein
MAAELLAAIGGEPLDYDEGDVSDNSPQGVSTNDPVFL